MKSSNNFQNRSNEDIFPDHYKTLGVSSNATITEIKQAFHALTHKINFDSNSSYDGLRKKQEDLNYAYDVLSDPILKEYYDSLYKEKFFLIDDSQHEFTSKTNENTSNIKFSESTKENNQNSESVYEENIFPDYYKVLKVDQTASISQINQAYKSLIKKNHPDKHPDAFYANNKTQELNEAYGVLSDPTSKAEYDNLYNMMFSSENPFNMDYAEYDKENTTLDSDYQSNNNSYWRNNQDSSDDDRPSDYFKVDPSDGPIYVPYDPYASSVLEPPLPKNSNYLSNNMFQHHESSKDEYKQDNNDYHIPSKYLRRSEN